MPAHPSTQSYIKGMFVVTCFTGSYTTFTTTPTPSLGFNGVGYGPAASPLTFGKFLQPQVTDDGMKRVNDVCADPDD